MLFINVLINRFNPWLIVLVRVTADPSGHWIRGGMHPRQVASSSQLIRIIHAHKITPLINLWTEAGEKLTQTQGEHANST